MFLRENIKPSRGIFILYDVSDGQKTELIHDDNIIVNSSFDILAGAIQGDTNKTIDTVILGDGGIIDSVLQTPVVEDTALYNQVFSKTGTSDIVVESILQPNYITFKFRILKTEGNGDGANIISEAGLMSSDGTMFSRKTFNEVIKTPQKEFLIEWSLQWA